MVELIHLKPKHCVLLDTTRELHPLDYRIDFHSDTRNSLLGSHKVESSVRWTTRRSIRKSQPTFSRLEEPLVAERGRCCTYSPVE
jgi:hypothetical protein